MRLYNYVLTCANTAARLPVFQEGFRRAREHYINAQTELSGGLIDGTDDKVLATYNLTVVHGMNCERFPRSPWWRVGAVRTELPDRQTGNGLDRRGHTACYWGHVQEWRQALGEHDDAFDDGAACFFEDDCRLDENFWTRVFEGFSELPEDWEIFYFGGELCVNGRPRPPVFSPHLFHADNVNRTHAYCVRLNALPKLVLWFEENHDWGHNFRDAKTGQSEAEIDYALGSLTESGFLNAYALRPWACGQAEGFSWTQGRNYPERRWEL